LATDQATRLFGQGSVAYAPQESWLQSGNVEQNILFGTPKVDTMYNAVVDACEMRADLQQLKAGDQTQLSEAVGLQCGAHSFCTVILSQGTNLSGGQKQRISLARACYQNRDIYLLDAPTSAVDSRVDKRIVENVIRSLLADKVSHTRITLAFAHLLSMHTQTRLVVTHNLGSLKHCDQVIYMKDGCVHACGDYRALVAQCPELRADVELYAAQHDQLQAASEPATRPLASRAHPPPCRHQDRRDGSPVGSGDVLPRRRDLAQRAAVCSVRPACRPSVL